LFSPPEPCVYFSCPPHMLCYKPHPSHSF
jgi:hypothetical protein